MEKTNIRSTMEKWKLNFISPGTKEEIDKRLANGMQNLTPHLQGATVTSYSDAAELEFMGPMAHTGL